MALISESYWNSSHTTCLPNTRVKVLDRIKDWARTSGNDEFLMWLHGAAGGGKTSIARTIAQWCEEQNILLGKFFFSRDDGTAEQFKSLVPTLAHNMAFHSCKGARETICTNLENDPSIFHASLAYQLKKMILEPLDVASRQHTTPHVIILDGLDEALSEEQQYLIIKALFDIVYPHNPNLRILICSRPEPDIMTTFQELSQADTISTIISLDKESDSDSDIRRFLVEKLALARRHLSIPPKDEWPSPADLDYLVEKASGQFIYAAVVTKYICSPKHPDEAPARLTNILDQRLLPQGSATRPFAELDALYTHCLKTRDDVTVSVKTMAICCEYPKYFDSISPQDLATVLNYDLNETLGTLYQLASLLEVTEDNIRPYHASFADFLFDYSRSGDLYVSKGDIATDITCSVLSPRSNLKPLSSCRLSRLLDAATPRQDLTDILSRMTPASILNRPTGGSSSDAEHLLRSLLKAIEKHVTPYVYYEMVGHFDQNSEPVLPSGDSKPRIGPDVDSKIQNLLNPSRMIEEEIQKVHIESNTIPDPKYNPQSVPSASIRDSGDFDIDVQPGPSHKHPTSLQLASYPASQLAPLITSPAWDDINTRSNIRLTGSEPLQGLCDEAHFVRSHLPVTFAMLLNESNQTTAALLCLREMTREDIEKDLRDAFAELLPHSLRHCAQQSPSIISAIADFRRLCSRQDLEFTKVTMDAISEYLKDLPEKGANTRADTILAGKTLARTAQNHSGPSQKARTNSTKPPSKIKLFKGKNPSKAFGQRRKMLYTRPTSPSARGIKSHIRLNRHQPPDASVPSDSNSATVPASPSSSLNVPQSP